VKHVKGLRHAKIKDIVDRHIVETQEDLAEALRQEGIEVTQATVSRDIKELMLVKIPTGDGHYRYAFPAEQNTPFSQSRMERTFQDAISSVDFSENIIVLRTMPGTAQSVAYNIDYVRWPEVLGTVAGDDTIFIIVKPIDAVPKVIAKFKALMRT
jgi:transcriptional regulator of arginine metabolism